MHEAQIKLVCAFLVCAPWARSNGGKSRTRPWRANLKQTCMETGLSRASVNSYLPYEKGVYMPEDCSPDEISVGAERIRRFRRKNATP